VRFLTFRGQFIQRKPSIIYCIFLSLRLILYWLNFLHFLKILREPEEPLSGCSSMCIFSPSCYTTLRLEWQRLPFESSKCSPPREPSTYGSVMTTTKVHLASIVVSCLPSRNSSGLLPFNSRINNSCNTIISGTVNENLVSVRLCFLVACSICCSQSSNLYKLKTTAIDWGWIPRQSLFSGLASYGKLEVRGTLVAVNTHQNLIKLLV
jgi:hypothetical protein